MSKYRKKSRLVENHFSCFMFTDHLFTCRCFSDITQCTDGYSMAIWLKISWRSLYSLLENKHIISSGGQTSAVTTGGMSIMSLADGLKVAFRSRPDGKRWHVTGIKPEANTWFHLVVTWNKYGYLTVYIDGNEVDKVCAETITFSRATSSIMRLGRKNNNLSNFGNFSIDEWFFWKNTLSREMVVAIYNLY